MEATCVEATCVRATCVRATSQQLPLLDESQPGAFEFLCYFKLLCYDAFR
ncbi:MAG: hypothetical protein Kow00122_17420 [Thermoleophilia bacterium]